jgi:hypothetical protein
MKWIMFMHSFRFSKKLSMEKQKRLIHIWLDAGLQIRMNSAFGPIICWICLFYFSSHNILFNLKLCMNKNQCILHQLIFCIVFSMNFFMSYESSEQGIMWAGGSTRYILEVHQLFVLIHALDLHDVGLADEVVHDLDLPPDVLLGHSSFYFTMALELWLQPINMSICDAYD